MRTNWNTDETGNIIADEELLAWIKSLEDFDLIMLLSEINQHGWDAALQIIKSMKDAGIGQ